MSTKSVTAPHVSRWQQDQRLLARHAGPTPLWVPLLMFVAAAVIGFVGIGQGRGLAAEAVLLLVMSWQGLLMYLRLDPMLRELRRLQAEVARLGGRQDQG